MHGDDKSAGLSMPVLLFRKFSATSRLWPLACQAVYKVTYVCPRTCGNAQISLRFAAKFGDARCFGLCKAAYSIW
jgi:hypothetical protein